MRRADNAGITTSDLSSGCKCRIVIDRYDLIPRTLTIVQKIASAVQLVIAIIYSHLYVYKGGRNCFLGVHEQLRLAFEFEHLRL